jgi:hypothetical protein
MNSVITEIRCRIIWALTGMYAVMTALEELLLRWSDSVLGRVETLETLTKYLDDSMNRSIGWPWFLLIFGLCVIVVTFLRDDDN